MTYVGVLRGAFTPPLALHRKTVPHEGLQILRRWEEKCPREKALRLRTRS